MSKAKKTGKTKAAAQEPAKPLNCWDIIKCGREKGGAQAAQLGVCPACPDHGRDCWLVAGTLCGGSVQGTYAEKLGNCLTCDVYQKLMCGEV